MLTGKEIGNLIAHPELVASEQLSDILGLAEKHPYSQLFSILYLKGLHASDSLDFETALKEHSYRISDRRQLYELIHTQTTEAKANDSALSIDPAAINEQVDQKQTIADAIPTDNDTITSDHDEVVKKIDAITETKPSLPPTAPIEIPVEPEEEQKPASQEEEIVDPSEETTQTATAQSETNVLKDPLEERILHHALVNSYQLEELSPEEAAALEEKQGTEEEIEEKVVETRLKKEESTIFSEVNIDAEQSFTAWLHADANYKKEDDTKSFLKAVVKDFSEFDPMESLFGEVEKPKKEFFSPTKKAKESLSEDQLPVSETLAKIYIVQGNYPKAIAAYNELILAFPEKKIFFANQIKDLQKKINT